TMAPVIGFPVRDREGRELLLGSGRHELALPLGPLELGGGQYSVAVLVQTPETLRSLARVQGLVPFRVASERAYWSRLVRPVHATRG
ncbi:MAG: hypothetical protein ACREQY_00080, partial [Candidatus Binatia bacterium]